MATLLADVQHLNVLGFEHDPVVKYHPQYHPLPDPLGPLYALILASQAPILRTLELGLLGPSEEIMITIGVPKENETFNHQLKLNKNKTKN